MSSKMVTIMKMLFEKWIVILGMDTNWEARKIGRSMRMLDSITVVTMLVMLLQRWLRSFPPPASVAAACCCLRGSNGNSENHENWNLQTNVKIKMWIIIGFRDLTAMASLRLLPRPAVANILSIRTWEEAMGVRRNRRWMKTRKKWWRFWVRNKDTPPHLLPWSAAAYKYNSLRGSNGNS